MEKDTRTFIWGLILLITGLFSLVTDIHEIKNHIWEFNTWNTIIFICSILSIILGGIRVIKTTN